MLCLCASHVWQRIENIGFCSASNMEKGWAHMLTNFEMSCYYQLCNVFKCMYLSLCTRVSVDWSRASINTLALSSEWPVTSVFLQLNQFWYFWIYWANSQLCSLSLNYQVNVYVSVFKTIFYSKQDRKPFSDGDLWAIYSWNQLQWLLRNFHHFFFNLDEYQHKWLSGILSKVFKQWAWPRPLFLAAVAHDVEQVVLWVVVWSPAHHVCIRMCDCTLQQHALCDVNKTGKASLLSVSSELKCFWIVCAHWE